MNGKFVLAKDLAPDVQEWGQLRWVCNPPVTGARDITVLHVTLSPGKGHNFHKHPDQEEVIYVVGGKVEQWIEREKKILVPGDSAFIPGGMVHASFNTSDADAHVIAILSPCVGKVGYEVIEVGDEAPWKGLRA